jgi:predicted methyltransferase
VKPLLSCYQANDLLAARRRGEASVRASLDLGKTECEWRLGEHGARAGAVELAWSALEAIAENDSVCFALDGAEPEPVRVFSPESNRSFQLWPTRRAPALVISGFLMHRVRDVTPDEGAAAMVRALGKVRGRLLDTTTGLGYAAIAASHVASEVVTIEIEPVARELARENPWSQELFDNPRLSLREGDSSKLIDEFAEGSFAAVLHDPPAINLAGELYAGEFYARVRRLLSRNGRFFHYIGDPDSTSGGRTTKGVVKRLYDAGFSRVSVVKQAFGVLANV